MTVREFLRTVWSGKYIVVACVLVAVVGAWLYVDRQGTLLESEAVVSLGVDGDGEVTSGWTRPTCPRSRGSPARAGRSA
jgi:hypothetical protein